MWNAVPAPASGDALAGSTGIAVVGDEGLDEHDAGTRHEAGEQPG